jgi:phospholipase C
MAVVILASLLVVAFVWQPFADEADDRAGGTPPGATTGPGGGTGDGNDGDTGDGNDGGANPTPTGPQGGFEPVDPRDAIEHVVFIVKENRTFNHYFGAYPGAEGSTTGQTFDGRTIELKPAPDIQPHDITHGFNSALISINGGKMNGFSEIGSGQDLTGYTIHSRETMPNYWAYADRFVLADHFFTSMFGPTFPEHLYTVAAQSYGIIDNKVDIGGEPSYCDDPAEDTKRFRDGLTKAEVEMIMDLEWNLMEDYPDNLYRLFNFTEESPTCIDIPVLPDQLEEAGVSWKYYARADVWMNALQAIEHIRFGPLWNKVEDPDNFIEEVEAGKLPAVSWLIPPRASTSTPGRGRACAPARTGPWSTSTRSCGARPGRAP